MSWKSDTRDTIEFTSPDGNEFSALWKGGKRTGERKLGIFDPPNFNGTIVQDLGVKSIQYPLTIFFQGLNHHKEAESFIESCKKERGVWIVIHPTKGTLNLQLVSFEEDIQPVENGNFTQCDLVMFEPANIETTISAQESITQTLSNVLAVIEDSIAQAKQLRSDLYAAVQAAANMINKISGLANDLKNLSATDAIINDAWLSAKSSLSLLVTQFQSDASDEDTIDLMCQALIDVIAIPLESSSDFTARFSAYEDFSESVTNLSPPSNTPEDYNKAIFQEFGIMAILISICRIIVTSDFTVRSEIIAAMDDITAIFNGMIAAIEDVQSNFTDLDIDKQYFSQMQSYTSLQKLFSSTMIYLTSQFFNLKTEKRFTLKKTRSPIEITVTEYGSLGDDDANYKLFLQSNNLYGKDILILPAGREVVIYV